MSYDHRRFSFSLSLSPGRYCRAVSLRRAAGSRAHRLSGSSPAGKRTPGETPTRAANGECRRARAGPSAAANAYVPLNATFHSEKRTARRIPCAETRSAGNFDGNYGEKRAPGRCGAPGKMSARERRRGEKSAIICCHLSYLLMDDSAEGRKKKKGQVKNSRRTTRAEKRGGYPRGAAGL